MGPKLRFLRSLLAHKWYVLQAGRKLGVPLWRLLVHDLSKFSPSEFGRYARWHHGPEEQRNKWEWVAAWQHHLHRNSHHPEHYLVSWHGDPDFYQVSKVGEVVAERILVLPVPEVCVREMVADWHAASKAYTGKWDIARWLTVNLPKMRLHTETVHLVDSIVRELGYIHSHPMRVSYIAGPEFVWR